MIIFLNNGSLLTHEKKIKHNFVRFYLRVIQELKVEVLEFRRNLVAKFFQILQNVENSGIFLFE